MKRLFALVSVIMLAGTLAACNTEDTENVEGTLLSLDINPSAEFIVDEDDEIDSYTPLNEDAEIVLADLDLEGMDYEEALDLYLEEATELGYIDVNADDNAVYISTNEDETTDEADRDQDGDTEDENTEDEGSLEDRVEDKVNEHFESRGIMGAAVKKDLEEEYGDIAEEYDIGLGKARLLSRAVELDEELTMEEAVEMNMGDVMAILRADHQERMEEFRQEKRGNGRNPNDDVNDEDSGQERGQDDKGMDTNTNGIGNAPVNFEDIRSRIAGGLENAPISFNDIKNRISSGFDQGNIPFLGNDGEEVEGADPDTMEE